MKILVDADACPVKNIILSVAKRFDLKIIMFIDTSHIYNDNYSEVITVDKGKDSVDFALANRIQKNDIVVTQDYGVAAMALSKEAYAIHQNGLIYNSDNIDKLLFERYLSQKIRKAGGRTQNQSKRTKDNDIAFEKALTKLCQINNSRS
jgi:uncharacterized protein YaiI (UPF0178 family)